MKKLIVILVALVGFGFSTYAGVIFRTTQTVCNGDEKVIFRNNGAVSVTTTSSRITGTYNIVDDGIEMYLDYEGETITIFVRATMSYNKSYLDWIVYDENTYERCN